MRCNLALVMRVTRVPLFLAHLYVAITALRSPEVMPLGDGDLKASMLPWVKTQFSSWAGRQAWLRGTEQSKMLVHEGTHVVFDGLELYSNTCSGDRLQAVTSRHV